MGNSDSKVKTGSKVVQQKIDTATKTGTRGKRAEGGEGGGEGGGFDPGGTFDGHVYTFLSPRRSVLERTEA
jgi:hypothetical protein